MQVVNVPGVGAVNFPDSMSDDDIVKAIQNNILPNIEKPKETALPAEPSSFMRRVGDVGLSTAQGVVGLGEAALGLADIPTGGYVGRGAEAAEKALFGGTSEDAQAYLQSLKSPEAKLAEQKVQEAKGFLPTAGALLENPSALLGSVAESLPSMFGGAALARAGMKALPTLTKKAGDKAAIYAAGAGEGAISAGSTAESIRQQAESGLLTAEQSAISGISGVLTSTLGVFGGRIANEFGVTDIDTLFAGGIKDAFKNQTKQSILKAAVKGAISESLFEELPQSMQEQISRNVATGKPWDENVAESGAMGAMAALVMGGGGAGAAQITTNAKIKDQQLRQKLEDTKEEVKPEKSMIEVLEEEDAAAEEYDEEDDEGEDVEPQPAKATPIEPTPAKKVSLTAQEKRAAAFQEKEAAREAAHPYGDTMIDEKTDFPLFAPREEESRNQREITADILRIEAEQKHRQELLNDDKKLEEYAVGRAPVEELRTLLEDNYANNATRLDALKRALPEAPPSNPVGRWKDLPIEDPVNQAPLFSPQQDLDFTQEQPIAPEGQVAAKPAPTKGQQALDFTQEVQQGEYTPPEFKEPKFGYTTETSAAPLQKFLGQIKPRSTSEVEQVKQQAALVGLQDKIQELYDDDSATPEQLAYSKGVVDTFFGKYAGLYYPGKQEKLNFINGLSAQEQRHLLREETLLPDLTTYEGVKKLSDAFEDHVAEAQLAGLGITRASSAYRQANPIVRSLRDKDKSRYDESEQAAYTYFSMFDLDMALRAAAFDIATNTPHSQLFRGQGRVAAEKFSEWVGHNAPAPVQKHFINYIRAYSKANRGFQALLEIQKTRDADKGTIAQYTEAQLHPTAQGGMDKSLGAPSDAERNQMMLAPLHPVVRMHIRNNNLDGVLKTIATTSASPYQRRLAARLAALDLNTAIGMDGVNALLNDYIPQSRILLGKLTDTIRLVYPDENVDAIMTGWDKAESNIRRFGYAKAIIAAVGKKEVPGFAQDVIKDLMEQITNAEDSVASRGVYFPKSNAISLNSDPKRPGLSSYIILHEVMHAATAHVINNKTMYSSKQQAAVKELEGLFTLAKEKAGGTYFYGIKDIHEFVAEAFTNSKFQDFLKGIKYKQSNRSLWDKFIQYCLELFGVDNVLTSTIAATNVLFETPNDGTALHNPGPLYAKRNKVMFESNSNERSKPFSILNDLVKNTKTFSDIKNKLGAALSTMNTEHRKHWLNLVTLRQMSEMLGSEFGRDETGQYRFMSKLPHIARYIRKIDQMNAERAIVLETHTSITRRLSKLQSGSPVTIEQLNKVVQFATTNEVDPQVGAPVPVDPANPTKKEKKQLAAYPLAEQLWDTLGGMKNGRQAQELYVEMRDFFATRLADFKAVAYEREYNRMLADALSASKKAGDVAGDTIDAAALREAAIAKIDSEYADKISPYFPLKRFGEFWVRSGSGMDRIYMQFEDAQAQKVYMDKERAKYRTKLKAQGFDDVAVDRALEGNTYINAGNSLPDLANDLFSSREVFDAVKNIVDTAGKDVTDVEEMRALMVDQLGELYITTLPLQSIRRMFLHRQNVSGASADLIRSFQHASIHMAYQHARFKFAPELDNELSAAQSSVNAFKRTNLEEGIVLQDYLNAINKKHKENIITPVDSPKWVNLASNFNFLWFLTAPASAIVNMLAIPAIALPKLGGMYGVAKTTKTFAKYMKLLSGAGWKTLDTGEFDVPSIKRSPKLTELQHRAYDSASAGLFEQSLAHDAANFSENPSLDYSGWWGRVMHIATFPFHKAERFNREVTYMSTFELAYERNGGNFQEAVNEASDLTYKTMFDYATFNKPGIMQGSVAKLLLAFKQYPQHLTYLLFRTGLEATQEVSEKEAIEIKKLYGIDAANKYIADTNRMRAEARKTFMLMMGMSMLFAGAAGLPMWWMYEGMANAFNAVFGDDDVPYDVNNEFKNSMNDVFGGFVGDSISRGVIPQLTGVALSDRMSTNLTHMWFRDVKKNQDEVDYAENMLISLLGPTVGILMKAPEALKRFNDGHVERAAEAMAPAVFKNILAGSRLAKEGALTMKGDTLIETISGPEAFKQMLGFTPERLAQRQSANIEAKSSEQEVINRRQDLLNALAMAMDAEDEAFEARVWEKIDKYNEANDWLPITYKTVRASMKKRAKNRAMADEMGGLNINKNFRDIAEEKTGYADEDEDEYDEE